MAITRERDGFEALYDNPPGLGRLTIVNHKPVGLRFLVTTLVFFGLGGVLALLMRLQLAIPENRFIDPQTYNELFTMHGTTMMFLFAVPFMEALAGYILPLMFGARDLPFPRLNAFNYWCYLFGGTLLYSSFLFGLVPDGGWFMYPPLTGAEFSPGPALDFWFLGVTFVEIATIGAAIEIIALILKMRPPGMRLDRIPLFGWSMLTVSFMIIFAFTPLVAGTMMFELDRKIGTAFFVQAAGGDALLWQHIFWFFAHPEVYIMFLPGAGIASMIIPVFARRAIAGYTWITVATVATGFVSFGLWIHHMYATGLPMLTLSFFAAASFIIAIPSGVQVFAWLATLATGRIRWSTPLLFVIGFIVIFTIGGITGVMVAATPFDLQVHDSFFVVAHFHYVLVGGVVFPAIAALYFWFPKITGRLAGEGLGKLSFWLTFIGFNLTFFPQHLLGLFGMPRRVYTYEAGLGWERDNMLSTMGALLLAVGLLVTVVNLLGARRRGLPAGQDPWGGDTLEWSLASPPPSSNFRTIPVVSGRHPIWDDPHPGRMYEAAENEPWGLTASPRSWRASLATSLLEARPEHVVHLPAPTAWPLGAGVGTLLFFVGVLADVYLLVFAGIAVFGVALFAWIRIAEDTTVPDDDPAATGLPVSISGGRSVQWMGALLSAAVALILVGTFVSSFFYLRAHDVAWPPDGVPAPGSLLPAVATGILLAAAFPIWWAWRARGAPAAVRRGLGSVILLGVGYLVVQVVQFAEMLPDARPDAHVYAAFLYAMPGLQMVLVVIGIVLAAIPVVRSWRAPLPGRLALLTDNAGLWWVVVVVSWVLTSVTLYLVPKAL